MTILSKHLIVDFGNFERFPTWITMSKNSQAFCQSAVQRLSDGSEKIAKIAEFDCVWRYVESPLCNLLFLLSVYCVFRSGLTDFRLHQFNFAAQDCHMSKFVGRFRSISPGKAPRTLPEPWRHSDGVLKNLWARCHCSAIAGRRVQSSDICSGRILYSVTLTGTSSLTAL